ncbi:unnamed protein product, partial [Allacma fusca]
RRRIKAAVEKDLEVLQRLDRNSKEKLIITETVPKSTFESATISSVSTIVDSNQIDGNGDRCDYEDSNNLSSDSNRGYQSSTSNESMELNNGNNWIEESHSVKEANLKGQKYLETSNIDTSDDEPTVGIRKPRKAKFIPNARGEETLNDNFTFWPLDNSGFTSSPESVARGLLDTTVPITHDVPIVPETDRAIPGTSAGAIPGSYQAKNNMLGFEYLVLKKLEKLSSNVKDLNIEHPILIGLEGSKLPISKTVIPKVVIKAVLKKNEEHGSTEHAIEEVIKAWFRNAKSRVKEN